MRTRQQLQVGQSVVCGNVTLVPVVRTEIALATSTAVFASKRLEFLLVVVGFDIFAFDLKGGVLSLAELEQRLPTGTLLEIKKQTQGE